MAKPCARCPTSRPPTCGSTWIWPGEPETGSYARSLELDRAIARTRFTVDGTTFEREIFATAVDGVIAIRIAASRPARLTLRLALTSLQSGSAKPAGDAGTLRFSGRSRSAEAISAPLTFAAELARPLRRPHRRAQQHHRGRRRRRGRHPHRHRHQLPPLRRPQRRPTAARHRAPRRRDGPEHRRPPRPHIADHRRYFDRLSIDLGTTPAAALPTDKRIAANATYWRSRARRALRAIRPLPHAGQRPRPGTQPANLQGIWNDLTDPPWGSKYHGQHQYRDELLAARHRQPPANASSPSSASPRRSPSPAARPRAPCTAPPAG